MRIKLSTVKLVLIPLLIGICVLGYVCTKYAIQAWFNAQYTPHKSASQLKILVAWSRGFGERETIERLKIVSKRLGVDLRAVTRRPRSHLRWALQDPIATAREIFQPDFILSIQDHVLHQPGIPNYMTLTLGTPRYLENIGADNVKLINAEHIKFDALLPSFAEIDQLQKAYENQGKKYQGFPWYPTVYATDYPVATPKKLFYSGGYLWDSTRSSQKYKEVFYKLHKAGYFRVCGPRRKWKHLPGSGVGLIPVDGKSLIQAHHDAGIALVLHSKHHLNGAAPTARIFEAIAAKTVVISDRHGFVTKNFGDNVLYVDVDQDAEGMFKQIDQHMQWIFSHPTEAQQMAESCYKIFAEKFTLEAQLQRLIDMHKALVADSAHRS